MLADLVVASATEVAAVLGSTATALQPVWPADAVEVEVDGRRRFVLPEVLDAVGTHPAPRLTRLLPPGDPWLQARDRDLLLPGTDRQKALWKAINAPGALLVDGELEGTWTAKQGRAGRVLVRVTVFEPLDPATAREVEAEAEPGGPGARRHLGRARNGRRLTPPARHPGHVPAKQAPCRRTHRPTTAAAGCAQAHPGARQALDSRVRSDHGIRRRGRERVVRARRADGRLTTGRVDRAARA
ncbi:hypothetical protein GCM10025868_12700 [Angustibacter aerolatus]|uniref:Winged helix DNA-binding domain-containing protein n=1 Tax=Angustibacter aerolatus TaxID=1162965 RepID=A0ABQ6JGP4_9ACTN|nr:hypothetical protein GCM10025868_12700 [Angustibacter aerolatus]